MMTFQGIKSPLLMNLPLYWVLGRFILNRNLAENDKNQLKIYIKFGKKKDEKYQRKTPFNNH